MAFSRLENIRTIVCVSDLHAGSLWSPCPPTMPFEGGGRITTGPTQRWLYRCWLDWRDVWVPSVVGNRPFALLVNGDMIEGVHHGGKELIAQAELMHAHLAVEMLAPLAARAEKVFYCKGTEAHEKASWAGFIGERLKSQKASDTNERFAQWWILEIGKGSSAKHVVCRHHMSTTTVANTIYNALSRIVSNETFAAAREKRPTPRVMVRGHRHIFSAVHDGDATCVALPPWQTATGHVHKVAPESRAMVGGVVIDMEDAACPNVLYRLYRSDGKTTVGSMRPLSCGRSRPCASKPTKESRPRSSRTRVV